MEVAKQTLKIENITKIDDILKIAEEKVETNIDWDTLMEYVPALVSFNADQMKTETLPGIPEYMNNVAFYLVDEDEAKQVVNELFLTSGTTSTSGENENTTNTVENQVSSGQVEEKEIKVEVLNGTGSSTRLENAIEQLEAQGYEVVKEGNTNITNSTVIINRTNNTESQENTLIALLGTGTAITGENNEDVDFTIILGKDY